MFKDDAFFFVLQCTKGVAMAYPWYAHVPWIRGKARARSSVVNGHVHVRSDPRTRDDEREIRAVCRAARGADPIADGWVVLGIVILDLVPASWLRTNRGKLTARARRAAWQEEPAAARPDADNCVKIAGDGANKAWFHGDARVMPIPWRGWTIDPERAGMHLFLWPAPTPAAVFDLCYGEGAPWPKVIQRLAVPSADVPRTFS